MKQTKSSLFLFENLKIRKFENLKIFLLLFEIIFSQSLDIFSLQQYYRAQQPIL